MCLTIDKQTKTRKGMAQKKPLIAKGDIYVYKRFRVNLKSPYQHFRYHYNTKYFLNKKIYIKAMVSVTGLYSGQIYIGIHAYQNIRRAEETMPHPDSFFQEKIIKCKIPKGSHYYLGRHEDIVTNCLTLPDKKGKFPRSPKKVILKS